MHTLNIQLPDPVFDEATRGAAASGLTVEAFVADVVREGLRATENDAPLTPEQVAKVRQAQAEIRAGLSLDDAQVDEHFTQKRAAWTQSGRA